MAPLALIKCIEGEKICCGRKRKEFLTIARIQLLFVDYNLNVQRKVVEYPDKPGYAGYFKRITQLETTSDQSDSPFINTIQG